MAVSISNNVIAARVAGSYAATPTNWVPMTCPSAKLSAIPSARPAITSRLECPHETGRKDTTGWGTRPGFKNQRGSASQLVRQWRPAGGGENRSGKQQRVGKVVDPLHLDPDTGLR